MLGAGVLALLIEKNRSGDRELACFVAFLAQSLGNFRGFPEEFGEFMAEYRCFIRNLGENITVLKVPILHHNSLSNLSNIESAM
jgi:hypothetical protein